jgi:hypothetical protein
MTASNREEWARKYVEACDSLIAANDNLHQLTLRLASKPPLPYDELTKLSDSYDEAKGEAAKRWAEVRALIDEMPD